MKDRLGQVIYVGKAKNLRKRVSSYFQGSRKFIWAQPKIGAMVEMVGEISTHETRNETEALLLEGKLIKEYKPRYNTDFTDDKQFLMVRVDVQNALPRFRLCRNRKEDGSHYYGPFAQAGMLRSTLSEMRKKFGILLHDAKPEKMGEGKWRLYDDARAEIFAGHNETTPEEYARGWRRTLVSFWKGGPKVGSLNCGRKCRSGRRQWILNGPQNFVTSQIHYPKPLKRTVGSPVHGPRMTLENGGLWRDWGKSRSSPASSHH